MTRILEFEAETRRVRVYAGGWAEFEAERRRALEAEARAYRDYSTARDRIVERARRKREWNERGYGQGRKKKKTKDARKAFEQELGRLERVEKPWSPWTLELDLDAASRPGAIVARLERAVVAAAPSASAPSTSRSRTATASRCSATTAPARPPCCGRCSGSCRCSPATAGSARAPSSASSRKARVRSPARRRCCARSPPRPA